MELLLLLAILALAGYIILRVKRKKAASKLKKLFSSSVRDTTKASADSAMVGLSEQIARDMFLGTSPNIPEKLEKAATKAIKNIVKKKSAKKAVRKKAPKKKK